MNDRAYKMYLILLFYTLFLLRPLATKKGFYLSTEHPTITYYNRKYAANLSFTGHHYSRRDPMYYLNIYVETLITLDNNITVHFYAVQYPSNGPILMELHYKWCNLIENDEIIGPLLRKYVPPTCPTPKGIYKIANMSTMGMPELFIEHLPFTKARVYMKSTIFNQKLVEAYADLEVKRLKT